MPAVHSHMEIDRLPPRHALAGWSPHLSKQTGKLVPETSPHAPSGGILFFGRSASETDRDGKRAFSIRAASPSFALLFPILLISRLA
jgi:hypothetical protein